MIARVLATMAVVVLLVAVTVGVYLIARKRSRDVVPGEPDRVSADIVTALMSELRKSQAEAAYWKSTAERLQREADEH